MLAPEMTPQVRAALDHIRTIHPDVTHVFYDREQRWFFCADSFAAPVFTGDENIGLLEDAADSVPYLPIAYTVDDDALPPEPQSVPQYDRQACINNWSTDINSRAGLGRYYYGTDSSKAQQFAILDSGAVSAPDVDELPFGVVVALESFGYTVPPRLR